MTSIQTAAIIVWGQSDAYYALPYMRTTHLVKKNGRQAVGGWVLHHWAADVGGGGHHGLVVAVMELDLMLLL